MFKTLTTVWFYHLA